MTDVEKTDGSEVAQSRAYLIDIANTEVWDTYSQESFFQISEAKYFFLKKYGGRNLQFEELACRIEVNDVVTFACNLHWGRLTTLNQRGFDLGPQTYIGLLDELGSPITNEWRLGPMRKTRDQSTRFPYSNSATISGAHEKSFKASIRHGAWRWFYA